MKNNGCKCRAEKNPKHTSFRKAEPYSRMRLIKAALNHIKEQNKKNHLDHLSTKTKSR